MKLMGYFTSYSGKNKITHDTLRNFFEVSKNLNIDLVYVFRYKYFFLEKDFLNLKKEFIYENKNFIEKKSEVEIKKAQDFLGVSFNLVRNMSSVPRQTSNLPDDDFITKVIFSWKEIYEKQKPDVIFFGLMDDYVGNIGLLVANAMKIPVLTSFGGGIQQSRRICDINYVNISKNLKKDEIDLFYEKAYDEWKDNVIRDKSVISERSWMSNLVNISNLFKLFSLLPKSIKTYYFEIPKVEQKLWLSPFCLAKRQIKYFISKNFSKLFYKKVPKNEYVLFPLNFLNDALIFTLIPKLDIVKEIKKLRMSLPTNVVLCIKPHPHWQCAEFSVKELIELSKIKGVVMVSPNENTRELIKKSELVIVLNSSVAYDCMFLNKPVVTLGTVFPKEVYEVKDYNELSKIIKNSSKYINVEENKRIIAELYANSIKYKDSTLYVAGAMDVDYAKKTIKNIFQKYELVQNKKKVEMKWPKIM